MIFGEGGRRWVERGCAIPIQSHVVEWGGKPGLLKLT